MMRTVALVALTALAATACQTEQEVRDGIRLVEQALKVDIPSHDEERIVAQQLAIIDAKKICAEQPYAFTVIEPAETCLRAVARADGWTPEAIDAWMPFVAHDVVAGESGGCWNVRGGATMAEPGVSCAIRRQGRGSDSGFGQLVSVHYRFPGGWLCIQEGLCSSAQIIDNPYDSARAVIKLVARSGKYPWCYNEKAKRYHPGCATAPGTPPSRSQ